MSRLTKIVLATALVVVGFGVAKFLGQPGLLPESLRSQIPRAQTASVAKQSGDAIAERSQDAGGVRLLPDTPVTHAEIVSTGARSTAPAAPALGHVLAPMLAKNGSTTAGAMPQRINDGAGLYSPIHEDTAPRATLRNEAPRPVGVDPQSPAAIRRTPPATESVADSYKTSNAPIKLTDAPNAPIDLSAPQLINAGYAAAGAAPSPAAVAASYNQPASSQPNGTLAPPPWPSAEERAEPRTHIVADGDTLEKLAGRYLTDPRRGREIYELNREVLSNPDLLPIGAELKIPARMASASWSVSNWQPNSSNASATGEVNRDRVIPVQPAQAQGIVPRAQLARPMMVE